MLSRYPMAPPAQARPRPTVSPTVSTLPTLPPRLLLVLDEWRHCHCRTTCKKETWRRPQLLFFPPPPSLTSFPSHAAISS